MALSPRAHVLLQGVLNCCLDGLGPALMNTLVELEQGLFQLAERARSTQEQVELYAEMKRLRDGRASFVPCFCEGLLRAFVALKMPREDMVAPPPMATPALTLVENSDIDRDILLHDIARRAIARHMDTLQLLGQRLAVLAVMPAFKPEQMPLGPHVLCLILRDCGETLGLNLNAQLTLYRAFECKGMERYGHVLECANRLLDQAGILPGLVYLPYMARSRHVSGDPASTVTCSTDWPSTTMTPSWSQLTAQRVSFASLPIFADQQAPLPAGPGVSNITNGSGVDSEAGTDTAFPVGADLNQRSDTSQAHRST
ncbi:MAG TPA: DUF1631 family protein, partial [Xylella taiwanensis]